MERSFAAAYLLRLVKLNKAVGMLWCTHLLRSEHQAV